MTATSNNTKPTRQPAAKNGHAVGVGTFVPGELLTVAELRRRTGWGESAVREAKKDGLTVRRIGNTRFVMTDDLIDFVKEHGQVEAGGSGTDVAVTET